jgi:hypothetical protein
MDEVEEGLEEVVDGRAALKKMKQLTKWWP